MFEFAIPLNELNNYDGTGKLGVFIAGYGTCTFVDSDYWCIPPPSYEPAQAYDFFNSSRYIYITVNAFNPPGEPGIDPFIIILVATILGTFGAVIIGFGLYFHKYPDKLKAFNKKLR